jgi:hypothetical protein
MITITEPSRANFIDMPSGQRMTALRFMLTIPIGTWFSISALPDYVFDYIFEVGTLQDLPWIRWQDDDLGVRIKRIRTTESPAKVARMVLGSPLFNRMSLEQLRLQAFHERIGMDTFELRVLQYCKAHSFKSKNIF